MIKLNIPYMERGDIKFKIYNYPDNQNNVVIDISTLPTTNEDIKILSRINNFIDIEILICFVKSLNNLGFVNLHLYNPMFHGQRSDRQFETGSCNYLKDVICPIINSLKFKTVTCIDPHSDVLEACLNNFRKIDNLELVSFALNYCKALHDMKDDERIYKTDLDPAFFQFSLISPDAGASKKIYKLAEQIGYKGDIITCSKDRDTEGKLTKIVVPIKDTGPLCKKDYIIIDDICDGGATFINIAQELKKLYNCNHIYLIVTHGIFSKGFDELSKYFDGIYTTNSYKDSEDYYFEFGDISVKRQQEFLDNNVKQLNVF
jgi:ribose-phosphate pyrophosphokinase